MDTDNKEEIPTVFIRFKDIIFHLQCPECNHKGMQGHGDLNIMYYVYLSAQLMKFNDRTRTIKLKAHRDNGNMFNTVLSLLDRTGIGWEVFDKKMETLPNTRDPTRKDEYFVCYLRRILK